MTVMSRMIFMIILEIIIIFTKLFHSFVLNFVVFDEIGDSFLKKIMDYNL